MSLFKPFGRLTALEIENFKAFGARQRIELAPITLLFGPNSAGKSTIVQALHYAYEVLVRNNLDVHGTELGGEAIDLGGFNRLVHKRDIDREVSIRLEFEVRSLGALDTVAPTDGDEDVTAALERVKAMTSVGLEFGVRWVDETPSELRVVRYEVFWDGERLLRQDSGGEGTEITRLCWGHPLFGANSDERLDDADELVGWDQGVHAFARWHPLGGMFSYAVSYKMADVPDALREPTTQMSRRDWCSRLGQLECMPPFARERAQQWHITALPARDIVLDFPRQFDVSPAWARLLGRLTRLPLDLARGLLETNFLYLGPLRAQVPRGLERSQNNSLARWSNGMQAWDELLAPEPRTPWEATFTIPWHEVGAWMSAKDRLDTGHDVIVRRARQLDMYSELWKQLIENGLPPDRDEREHLLESLPMRERVVIEDLRTGVEVEPCGVGIGITQLLPVVVAVMQARGIVTAVEQPELHLHPAVQARLGDLFISRLRDELGRAPQRTFLVETHSEHLMLRLLRRIRETHDGELDDPDLALTPAHVAVLYVEPTDAGVTVTRLRVSDDGEFADAWPRGFFDERMEELY